MTFFPGRSEAFIEKDAITSAATPFAERSCTGATYQVL
jgi:hypothetical protein